MMRAALFVAGILLALVSISSSQEPTALPHDTIAQFGSTVVTPRELIHRVEAVPFPGNDKTARLQDVRLKALYAIIAEKLLGEEAKRLGLRRDDASLRMDRELENLFVRDALYKREVSARVRVSEEEIKIGASRLPYELKVLSFLVGSRSGGELLARRLRQLAPHNVLSTLTQTLYTQVDTITIRFGAPDTTYENSAFSLRTTRVSKPFLSQNFGWAVLYLLDRLPNAAIQKMNSAERRRRVEKIVKDRHEAAIAAKYYYGILQSHHANAVERTFSILTDSLSALWAEDTLRYQRNGSFILTSDMIEILAERLQPWMDSSLVRMEAQNPERSARLPDGQEGSRSKRIETADLRVGEVLEMLRYEDLLCRNYRGDAFKIEFNEELKSLVAREFIARKGRAENLPALPEVQNDLRTWTGYLSAGALWKLIRDSVAVRDEDISRHLVKNNNVFGRHFEVNIREILCSTLNDANMVMDQLKQGRSFAELASVHSIRSAWANRKGESGFFLVGENPEIGFRALLSDTGKAIGPLALKEGYSIFTLLGKRRTAEAPTSLDSLKQNIRLRLLEEKRKQAVNWTIAGLARRQQLVIDYNKLKQVKFSLIPTFTRRSMGFGGRMTAVPLLMQQWDWMKEYQPPSQIP